MPSRFLEALRERLTLRTLGAGAAVSGFLYLLFDGTAAQLLASAIGTAIVGLTDVAGDAYDLRESVQHGGLGLSAIAGGAAMLAFDAGDLAIPLVFLAVGTWLVLDAVQTVRHEGATKDDTPRDGREVYRDYVARQVHRALAERPLTRRELHDELDADDPTVDAAVERLRDRGVVERFGSELRVEASRDDPNAASQLLDLARRVARPIALEFENGWSSQRDRTGRARSTGDSPDRMSSNDGSERIEARD